MMSSSAKNKLSTALRLFRMYLILSYTTLAIHSFVCIWCADLQPDRSKCVFIDIKNRYDASNLLILQAY